MRRKITPFIIGIDGLIGNVLWHYYRSKNPLTYGTSRKGTDGLPSLDLENLDLKKLQIDLKPFTHAIIAAGIPNIKACEMSPHSTRICNVDSPLQLARQFALLDIQPVLFSTDYVFDGLEGSYDEKSLLSPLNEYGRQKAELEKNLPAACSGNYLLLRLSKVFVKNLQGKGLLGEIADKLRENQKILAAKNLVFSPILLDDVVRGIEALLDLKETGLFNIGGSEIWDRYALSLAIAKAIGANPENVTPILIEDLNECFQRPKKTNLISEKFTKSTKIKLTTLSSCTKN